MKLIIFCNVSTRKPEATTAGQALTFPDFTAGDRLKFGVRFLEQIDGARSERSLKIRNARLTLGIVDAQPTSGHFSLQVGSGGSTAANTTPLMAHNVSAASLAATINALTAVAGTALAPCTAVLEAGTYAIAFADGSDAGLSVVANSLSPISFARLRERETNGSTAYELRLIQAPLAQASTFSRELPPEPTIETVQEGGTDPSGVSLWPEIQRLTISPLFRGSFILRFGSYQKSPILSPDVDAETLADALVQLFTANEYTPEVREEGDGKFLIVFNDGNSLGLDIAAIVPEVFTAAEGDVTFDLDLDTREVFDALRAASPRKDCVIELEAEIVDDDEEPSDPDAVGRTVTLLQAPAILRRELRWNGLEAASTVDWLKPPEPRDYTPFSTDQVLTGNLQAFSGAIGDGVATEFEISHNLGSELCIVHVRENTAGGAVLEPSEYAVAIDSEDQITVTFPVAPTLNQYVLSAVAVGPDSAFQSHTHTIAQVTGLQTILDDLGSRIEMLEAILPSTGAPAVSSSTGMGMDAVFPEIEEVISYRGDASPWSETGLDMEILPARPPLMLPAVHDGTLTDPLPDPLPSAAAGTVWVADGRTLIPGGGGIRSAYVEDNGFIASDGRMLYPATRSGTTNSYHPAAFERTLFAMAVNDKMLALGRTFEATFGVLAQLAHHNCKAQWILSLQLGTFAADTTPSTVGLNLSGVTWAAPVFEQPIVLSRIAQSHFFGVRIKRLAGEFTLDQQIYGVWGGNNAAAPANANFAIRARLDRFDTENATDPRGWVAWKMIGSLELDEQGKQTTKPAKATIY